MNHAMKRVFAWLCSFGLTFSMFGTGVIPAKAESETVVGISVRCEAGSTAIINATNVNVRQGAGTTYTYVLGADGSKIQLNYGQEVIVQGQEYAQDGALWYKVSFVIYGQTYEGYVYGLYVKQAEASGYTIEEDFEKHLEQQGFPASYKDALRMLHAKYPKWVFLADHLGYDWTTALNNESITGRSLVPDTSITSWKSTEPTAYDANTGKWYGFDGAAWVAASKDIVAYSMDPRNFLDETSIFQFEKLAYDTSLHSMEGVVEIVKDTFMENAEISNDSGGMISYAQALMNTALLTAASPYHLASRIIQEMGRSGGTRSISGVAPGYEGIYNYYNQGAYAHSGRDAVTNGLIYARKQGWTTRYKAILGGASNISSAFIAIGQNTLYYQKFDFVGTPYTHQYMTNILAPASEAVTVSQGYSEQMKAELPMVFVIPVFENMPDTVASLPRGDGNPNNILDTLWVDGHNLTPTYSRYEMEYSLIVGANVESVTIGATAVEKSAKISGVGTVTVLPGDNTFKIDVTAKNGGVRTYTIYIHRDGNVMPNPPMPVTPVVPDGPIDFKIDTSYTIKDERITGVNVGDDVSKIMANIKTNDGTLKIVKADGTDKTGAVATGDVLVCTKADGTQAAKYYFVVYGDLDGDGVIGSMDLLAMKRHILGIKSLGYLESVAADVDKAMDGVTAMDLLNLKRHILNIKAIQQ